MSRRAPRYVYAVWIPPYLLGGGSWEFVSSVEKCWEALHYYMTAKDRVTTPVIRRYRLEASWTT